MSGTPKSSERFSPKIHDIETIFLLNLFGNQCSDSQFKRHSRSRHDIHFVFEHIRQSQFTLNSFYSQFINIFLHPTYLCDLTARITREDHENNSNPTSGILNMHHINYGDMVLSFDNSSAQNCDIRRCSKTQ